MESSLVSPGHNIQHPYVKKEHSYVREEHSYVREEQSTCSDCFDGKYALPPNLKEDMELEEFDVIKYPTTSDCFNENYVPTHNPYTEDMLDLKPFDLINYITTDSSCNIPMETGSQQTHSAWDVDRTGVEASKSAAYQSRNGLPYYRPMRPMTTYDANMPLQSTTNVNPITQVYDQNKRQNQTNAPLFNNTPSNAPYVYDVLSPWEQNIPDLLCNTPMETGSQQEQVVAKDEDPEFKKLSDQLLEWEDELLDLEDKKRKRESMYKTEEVNVYGSKLSSLGQNIPDSFCNTPMETGSQQEQVVATDGDPEFTAQLLDLEKEGESNVYGSKLSSLGQNIPDSFCNTPMETGSQQTSSAWDVDCTGVEASKSAAYQSMNVLHDDTPITTDSQQKQMETKGHQRAKQLREKYKPALPTIEREHPLKHFYSRMQIKPCLGACISTQNVSVLHNTNCVLYNRPLLQELQNKNPKILQQVKEHLTNINMDRDDFKNLLFHEKLSKMLDKIECALAYIGSCCDKYIYLVIFKLQLMELVDGGINPHHNPNPVIKFLNHMEKKITDVDELILDLMQKDMSYYKLKVDLNNMLDMMSHHEYAEMGESYYHGLELESRIDTFIENYKKVSESVKEKLDIQNNYTDCESISFYYKNYKEYLNLLINSLDETNSVPNNNSGFVEDPIIISNPHLTDFYTKMYTAYYNKLCKQNRKPCQLTTKSDICLFMEDLSRLLDATEELHVALGNTLEILSNSKPSDNDVYWFKCSLENAKKEILCCPSEKNRQYLSVKELGRMEMKKMWVYRNTKVPIKAYSLRCMTLCMWLSLLRGSTACKTVKENLNSTLCKELGSKFQLLEEYIDYQKNLIDELKTKWFPKKMVSQKKQKT